MDKGKVSLVIEMVFNSAFFPRFVLALVAICAWSGTAFTQSSELGGKRTVEQSMPEVQPPPGWKPPSLSEITVPVLSAAETEQRLRESYSKFFGLPPDDEEITLLIEQSTKPRPPEERPAAINRDFMPAEKKVLNFFHFQEGVAFSSATKQYDEQKEAIKKRRKAFMQRYMREVRPKLIEKKVRAFRHPPKPPACARSFVNKVKARSNRSSKMDLLFIDGYPQGNPDELYGEGVRVIPYSLDQKNSARYLYSTFKIPCLPYRVYGSKDDVYYMYGEEALKRYDDKKHKRKEKD